MILLSVSLSACMLFAQPSSPSKSPTPPSKPIFPTEPRKPDNVPAENRFEEIVDPKSEAKVIASDFKFTEGPLWIPGEDNVAGYLLFSDIPDDTIYKLNVSDEKAKPEVWMRPSGRSNGLTLDHKGRLVFAQHDGRIARRGLTPADAKVTVLVEKHDGKGFNSPNDLVVASDGAVYFTDPPYGTRPPLGSEGRTREMDFTGIYRLAVDGKLELLTKEFKSANGLAFSPDGKTLYVTETGNGNIQSFPVKPDGTLGEPKKFACNDAGSGGGSRRGADGIKVDTKGNVYAVGPGGVWVYSPDGTNLGVIAATPSPTNLCFGGPDNKTLFMTTRDSISSIPVKIPGIAPSGKK